jgi:pilus assembly protein Flp/PilA
VKQLSGYLIGLNGRIMTVVRGEDGQGLVEYGLILFFIALVAVAALTFLGSDISTLLSEVGNKL